MRIATIGSGPIVNQFITGAQAVIGVEIAAIFSRDLSKAEAKAKQFNVAKAYDSLEAIKNDPEIDFVYIALPNALHYEYTKAFILAGKNVICEKPFMTSSAETIEIMQLAEEQNVYVFEGIPFIYSPIASQLKEDTALLDKIKTVQCNYAQYSSRYDELLAGKMTNIFDLSMGGGALMDINIYNLHFCTYLFGKPEHVEYVANKFEDGVDTSGTVMLQYPTFTAFCFGAKDAHGHNFAQMEAENGYIYIDTGINGMTEYVIHRADKKETVKQGDAELRLQYEVEAIQAIFAAGDYEAMRQNLEHSLTVSHILDAARQSAKIQFK